MALIPNCHENICFTSKNSEYPKTRSHKSVLWNIPEYKLGKQAKNTSFHRILRKKILLKYLSSPQVQCIKSIIFSAYYYDNNCAMTSCDVCVCACTFQLNAFRRQ